MSVRWHGIAGLDAGRPFAEAVATKIAEFPEYEPYITAYHTRWPEMVMGSIPGTVGNTFQTAPGWITRRPLSATGLLRLFPLLRSSLIF